MGMNSNDLKKSPLYQTQKQFRDIVDAQIEAEQKAEQIQMMREEKIDKTKDRIESQKNVQYSELQNKRNYRISLWSFVVAVIALIVSLISLFRGN